MDLIDSLEDLARLNRYGLAFLVAFGSTWLVCGVLWRKLDEKKAALATIVQGGVGFPLAIGLSIALGAFAAFGADRPVDPAIDQLSYLIGASQMLGLPFVVHLYMTGKFLLVPFAMASVTSMHFVLYTWLYQTPIYTVMAILIALGTFALMQVAGNRGGVTARSAAGICFFTGLALIGSGLVLQLI